MERTGAQGMFVRVWVCFEIQIEILGLVNVSIWCKLWSDTLIPFVPIGCVLSTFFCLFIFTNVFFQFY